MYIIVKFFASFVVVLLVQHSFVKKKYLKKKLLSLNYKKTKQNKEKQLLFYICIDL